MNRLGLTLVATMDVPPPDPTVSAPPRAFSQGVGTVFQWAGVSLFLVSFFTCCGSALISRDRATQSDLTRIGWKLGSDQLAYSAQRAITVIVPCSVLFGLALAGIGLGLQAQHRRAAVLAVVVTLMATAFWLIHAVFFASVGAFGLMLMCIAMLLVFAALFALAVAALRDLRANPPVPGHEILPKDYKIPYSHMHEDPPEVRLARELDQRRQRLAVQQKELEMLEDKLKRKLQQTDE